MYIKTMDFYAFNKHKIYNQNRPQKHLKIITKKVCSIIQKHKINLKKNIVIIQL